MTLGAVLDDMDTWIARNGTESAGEISSADVLRWRAAHAAALEHVAALQEAGSAVVSAYLLRPSPSLESSRPAASSASGWRKHMNRLAAAMAELERRLAGLDAVGRAAEPPEDGRSAGEAT